MKTAVLEEQREKLIEMGRRIEQEFNQHAEAIADDIAAPGDSSGVPTHLADRDVPSLETELAVGHSQDEILLAIRAALARMDEGTYGICENCGRPISQQRLQALPYAVRCVDCQRDLGEEQT